jgi:tartrate/fumarate subfamily iron-sulfur-dependent hydro-lyase alpha chain
MNTTSQIPNAAELAALVEAAIPQLASTLRPDYLAALQSSVHAEKDERGKAVLSQLVANSELAAAQGLPICQDTGYVWVCLEVGGAVSVPAAIFSQINAAVARAYKAAGLRNSMLANALIDRSNTGNNTPAFCEIVASPHSGVPTARLHIMLKGGGSDNASQLAMLPPGAGFAGIKDFVVHAVQAKGANACPPLLIGVGVGGSFDKVGSLAKHALLRLIGSRNANEELHALEVELLKAVNATGIGPGGLGGSTTALALHLETAPCHIAALPVAVNLGCCALRSTTIDLLA